MSSLISARELEGLRCATANHDWASDMLPDDADESVRRFEARAVFYPPAYSIQNDFRREICARVARRRLPSFDPRKMCGFEQQFIC